VAAVIRSRREPAPFVVLGDLNASEGNRAVRFLKGELPRASDDGPSVSSPNLVDTFRVLHPEKNDVGTFNGWRDEVRPGKIDYVFAPSWMRVLEARILRDREGGRYPSDHFPVSARLVVPRVRES